MRIKDVNNRLTKKSIKYYSGIGNNSLTWQKYSDNNSLTESYQNIPDVRMIINYIASQMSKVRYILKEGDRVIDNSPILDLLNEPNDTQSWYEFIKLFIVNYEVYGNAYINAFAPVGMQPSKLFILPAANTEILTNTVKDFRTVEIKEYLLNLGYQLKIQPEFVLHKKNTNLSGVVYGQSNLIAGEKPFNSITAGYEAKVTFYQKRGALGILTSKTSGSDAFTAPTKQEIKELQKEFEGYGLNRNQYQHMITAAPMEWQSMTQPLKDFEIMESTLADRRLIANLLGVPALIFTDESATFSNKKEVMKEVWASKFIPFCDDFFSDLTNFLKTWYKGRWELQPDYSTITELQADYDKEHEQYMEDIQNGVRTRNEVREILGLNTIPDEQANTLDYGQKENDTETNQGTEEEENKKN